jgi:hypothetical protein
LQRSKISAAEWESAAILDMREAAGGLGPDDIGVI